MNKIPLHLITGFLGSGKTSFLKSCLSQLADKQRVAVIQNEFSDTGIDGRELQSGQWKFDMLEVNKGSLFCVCLFSDFRVQLHDFIAIHQPDIILLEATGLADPLSIGQLLMDENLQKQVYLARIWTIIDALHFARVKSMPAVKNQIRVADVILLNKTDLISEDARVAVADELKRLNPVAQVNTTTFCRFELTDPFAESAYQSGADLSSPLKDIRTNIFKTTKAVRRKNLNYLISTLNAEVYRLKGYILLDNQEAVMIQSVFGQTTLLPVDAGNLQTEIISLGSRNVDFELLLNKMIIINK